MELRLRGVGEHPRLPKDVGTRQGRVAAELNLHRRSEPAETEPFLKSPEEGRLGEVHLPCHLLHPVRFTGP